MQPEATGQAEEGDEAALEEVRIPAERVSDPPPAPTAVGSSLRGPADIELARVVVAAAFAAAERQRRLVPVFQMWDEVGRRWVPPPPPPAVEWDFREERWWAPPPRVLGPEYVFRGWRDPVDGLVHWAPPPQTDPPPPNPIRERERPFHALEVDAWLQQRACDAFDISIEEFQYRCGFYTAEEIHRFVDNLRNPSIAEV